jgi:hypothetical protein
MKIVRAHATHSLHTRPLNGFDMFLLELLVEELSLSQLIEISPRGALESVRHVIRLARMGLLRLSYETLDERLLTEGWSEEAAQELLDDAMTLRPPRAALLDEQPTLPPQGRTSMARPISTQPEASTGIRRRPAPSDPTQSTLHRQR